VIAAAPGRGVVLVAVAGDKRSAAFVQAWRAREAGSPRPGSLTEISWEAALERPARLGDCGRPGDLLRVESPGSDVTVWARLARMGGFVNELAHAEWRPGQAWFRGLSSALEAFARATPHLVPTHPVDDVLAMTDKLLAHERLVRAGVPVPTRLDPAHTGDVPSFRAALVEASMPAVFVKPRWGSSGAGVLAYRTRANGAVRERLTTTARVVDGRIWNDKRLCTYTDRATIDHLLGAVLADGAIVQRWVPKAGAAGGPFDLRVLVIGRRAAYRVARMGRGTITNLHLDAARLGFDEALAPFGARVAGEVLAVCRATAACFPRSLLVAIDVMIDPRGRPFVLEANAWGDYLPGLLDDGRSTYEAEIQALATWAPEGSGLAGAS
jgi:glutathione synthase/RimK-type ligase-like ATP-grasp enzyme